MKLILLPRVAGETMPKWLHKLRKIIYYCFLKKLTSLLLKQFPFVLKAGCDPPAGGGRGSVLMF